MSKAALGLLFTLGASYAQDAALPDTRRARLGVDVVEVDEEVAIQEFFAGIEGDAMMLQVISDMNGLESFLESRNVSRSAGGELIDDGNLDERTMAAEDSLAGLKRFAEFKQLVSWLQPVDKRITRFCFYGCWCLPEGAHSFVSGVGRPVDLVDRSCQQLWFCYTCAMAEFQYTFTDGKHKRCDPKVRRYTFKFRYDRYHPKDYSKRDIKCKDAWILPPWGNKAQQRQSCARAICECDRGTAIRLGRFHRHWDKSRHRIWSISVKDCGANAHCSGTFTEGSEDWTNCRALPENSCLFITTKRCVFGDTGGQGPEQEEICCGVYEDEGRRFIQRDHGGTFACCAHDTGAGSYNHNPWDGNMFNVLTHCCPDGTVLNASDGGCPP